MPESNSAESARPSHRQGRSCPAFPAHPALAGQLQAVHDVSSKTSPCTPEPQTPRPEERPRGRERQRAVVCPGLCCSHTGLVLSKEGAFLRRRENARCHGHPHAELCRAGRELLWRQLATGHRSALAAQGEGAAEKESAWESSAGEGQSLHAPTCSIDKFKKA